MKRNPPSKGYEYIGEGTFATAYKKDERIELIITPASGRKPKFDLSRELLILARESATPAAKAHLPDISRDRIDIVQPFAEIVYSMPNYESYLSLKNDLYAETIYKSDGSRKSLSSLPDGLIEAVNLILDASVQYGAKRDFRYANFSQSKDGHLIIRDPFYCMQTGYDEIRMSELWPADQFAIFDRMSKSYTNEYDSQNK